MQRLVVHKRFHFAEPPFRRPRAAAAVGDRLEQVVDGALQLRQGLLSEHREGHLVGGVVPAPRDAVVESPSVPLGGVNPYTIPGTHHCKAYAILIPSCASPKHR